MSVKNVVSFEINLWILIDKFRSSYELIIPRITVDFKFMRKTVSSDIISK